MTISGTHKMKQYPASKTQLKALATAEISHDAQIGYTDAGRLLEAAGWYFTGSGPKIETELSEYAVG